MRTATVATTRRQASRQTGGGFQSSFAALPRIDSIPAQISLRPERAEWANLALWCDDAGLIKPRHWQRAYNAEETVLLALTDWASDTGKLALLGCSFSIEIADGPFGYDAEWKDILKEREQDSTQPHLAVSMWPAGTVPQLVIGNNLLALEEECPGLAGTALEAIRNAANRTIDVIDPARSIGIASWMFWMGEQDERYAVEEADGDVDEEYLIRRASFDEHAPAWAWHPKKTLTMKALKAITKNPWLSERARQVAGVCHSMARFRNTVDLPMAHQGLQVYEPAGIGACLWWDRSEQCPMGRVWDEFEQSAMQSDEGYSECFGVDTFEASEAGFTGWLKHKQQWFRLARMLDSLIGLVGEEIQ